MAFYRILMVFVLFIAAVAAHSTTKCNGHAEYCNRRYSNVSLIGAHDSPFVGPLPQQNQNIEVTAQLNFGIRFLQGQTHQHPENGKLELCHTSCLLEDAGSLEDFLRTVKTWMDNNPNEVITLLLTNGDSLPVSRFNQAFTSSGIKPYAFVPPSNLKALPMNAWPTLKELIDSGTRLVVFLDYGADVTTVPYILDEFAYFFETPYDVTDSSFSDCSIDRPAKATPDGRMYIVNHFLDVDILGILVPDRLSANKTNAATGPGSIGAQSDLCRSIHGRIPNFVLVDFVDQGDVLRAQDALNGL
ncbi:hypothetical protein VTN00DRAFT_7877 [Thermoascus crustaceus]|uniref:uncharacterized protein n=1 Tax=Thermoascus crustaceus TaxID=5088 RepID=UPI0037425D7D